MAKEKTLRSAVSGVKQLSEMFESVIELAKAAEDLTKIEAKTKEALVKKQSSEEALKIAKEDLEKVKAEISAAQQEILLAKQDAKDILETAKQNAKKLEESAQKHREESIKEVNAEKEDFLSKKEEREQALKVLAIEITSKKEELISFENKVAEAKAAFKKMME